MDNKDLVWDLASFQKKKRAEAFVVGFENKLCIYSGYVEQLYTNYNIFFPKEENRNLVILPSPYAHHDTFHNITENIVKPTGLFIVPANSEEVSDSLDLLIPFGDKNNRHNRQVPLEVGLKLINSKRPSDRPFLPILVKGDLRELNKSTPCLHLHSLMLSRLPGLSKLEVSDIQKVILTRLQELTSRK